MENHFSIDLTYSYFYNGEYIRFIYSRVSSEIASYAVCEFNNKD